MAEVVAIASTVVLALCGAIAKLWTELRAERARNAELAERLNKDHKRDLRWALGMPTSMDPGPSAPAAPSPPLLIREARPGPPRPTKKPRN